MEKTSSKGVRWTGRILTIILILFLLFDAITKLIKETHTLQTSSKIGWPVDSIQGLGGVLLACTILYAIPRTALLGAILITGYLGGATAINVRVGYPFIFPVIFGILIWVAVVLREGRHQSGQAMKISW